MKNNCDLNIVGINTFGGVDYTVNSEQYYGEGISHSGTGNEFTVYD